MSNRTHAVDEALADYIRHLALPREHPVAARLRERTAELPNANMQIAVEQGLLLALLARSVGARRAIEVGVFTGYSGLSVARALPDDGKLVACDVSEEWTALARKAWEEAGVAHKIDLRLAPALETLDALLDDGMAGTFDFGFIDADKENYLGYYERCLDLLRPGGLLTLDNVFWSGKVVQPQEDDAESKALRAVSERAFADDRVDAAMIPIADGLLVARKR